MFFFLSKVFPASITERREANFVIRFHSYEVFTKQTCNQFVLKQYAPERRFIALRVPGNGDQTVPVCGVPCKSTLVGPYPNVVTKFIGIKRRVRKKL